MSEKESYLNYPGLKYYKNSGDVDWNQYADSYLNYSGLKRVLGQDVNVDNARIFLSYNGLRYLKYAKHIDLKEEEELK